MMNLARKMLLFGGGEAPRVEQDIGDQTTAGSTSDTATFAAATTTGNGVIVTFALKSGARVSTLTDNKGNTYRRIGFAVDASDAVIEMWDCQPIVGGASHQLTVTYDTTAFCVWGALEASRVSGGAWYDSRTLATKTLGGGSSAAPFITSGVPRASNELFVAALALAGGGADAGISTPATWNEVVKFNDFDSVMAGHTAHKRQPTSQALTAQWPTGTTTAPAAMIIAGFRGTGAVSGGAKPVNTVAPAISGTPTEGQTLTASTGTWSNSPDAYTYQWRDDGVNISGATASTYVLTASEVGATITVRVTASNEAGSTVATSAGVGPVAAAFTGAFDGLSSTPTGLFSVARRMVTSYEGDILRIRRSSDSTTLDIGYDGDGLLDTTALLAFCGAGDGYIERLYNQSPSADPSTDYFLGAYGDLALVLSGTIQTLNGSPAIYNNRTARAIYKGANSGGCLELYTVSAHSHVASWRILDGPAATANTACGSERVRGYTYEGDFYILNYDGTYDQAMIEKTADVPYTAVAAGRHGGGNLTGYLNGTATSTVASGDTDFGPFGDTPVIGGTTANEMNGYFSELATFDVSISNADLNLCGDAMADLVGVTWTTVT